MSDDYFDADAASVGFRSQAEMRQWDLQWRDELIAKLTAERDAARHTLMELRTRLHAAGRRPEECYEMSLIDDALGEPR